MALRSIGSAVTRSIAAMESTVLLSLFVRVVGDVLSSAICSSAAAFEHPSAQTCGVVRPRELARCQTASSLCSSFWHRLTARERRTLRENAYRTDPFG